MLSSILFHVDEEFFCLLKSLQEETDEELWVDMVKSQSVQLYFMS